MYLDFFRLREKPFNVTPDPHFLYMSPSHEEAFANLLYGIRERKGFVAMTGEVGTGKTTLLHNLLTMLEDDIKTVFVFHTGLDFVELLDFMHSELGIEKTGDSKIALMQSLNRYLIDQLKAGFNVALIIDEAQNLDIDFLENLRLLSNLETSKDKLLQIVLVGQPELAVNLARPELRQLRQRINVQGQIQPLSLDESRAYVLHRLGVAGASATPVFTDEALTAIVEASGGIPRQLNMVCDNAMLVAYADGQRLVKINHARESIADTQAKHSPAARAGAPRPVFSANGKKRRRIYRIRRFTIGIFSVAAVALIGFTSFQLGAKQSRVAVPDSPQPVLQAALEPALPPVEEAPVVQQAAAESVAADQAPEADFSTTTDSPIKPETVTDNPPIDDAVSEFAKPARRVYRIKPGDSINRIIYQEIGFNDSLLMDEIRALNPHIDDFNHIEPGWRLFLPLIEGGVQ